MLQPDNHDSCKDSVPGDILDACNSISSQMTHSKQACAVRCAQWCRVGNTVQPAQGAMVNNAPCIPGKAARKPPAGGERPCSWLMLNASSKSFHHIAKSQHHAHNHSVHEYTTGVSRRVEHALSSVTGCLCFAGSFLSRVERKIH